MMANRGFWAKATLLILMATACGWAQADKRMVIADQDASGPAGSDQRALMLFLQSPEVELLGITVVTGDAWRDEEVAHTLRMLELVGRTDVQVYPGAVHPLWHNREWSKAAEKLYGRTASFQGAWRDGYHAAEVVPPLREGNPTSKPAVEDAAHFMVRMVREHPGKVTIFCAGPMTNVALALALDPHFAEHAQELVLMGGSLSPQTQMTEWTNNPRHEFNFWFDPEAASVVLRAPWKKIVQTTIDASLKTHLDPEVLPAVYRSSEPAARYLKAYTRQPLDAIGQIAWDELAALTWLDPSVIKSERVLYEDVLTDHTASYGDVITWEEAAKPPYPVGRVHLVMEPNIERLNARLIELLSASTPGSVNPQMSNSQGTTTNK